MIIMEMRTPTDRTMAMQNQTTTRCLLYLHQLHQQWRWTTTSRRLTPASGCLASPWLARTPSFHSDNVVPSAPEALHQSLPLQKLLDLLLASRGLMGDLDLLDPLALQAHSQILDLS